jgi:hypothetical protein
MRRRFNVSSIAALTTAVLLAGSHASAEQAEDILPQTAEMPAFLFVVERNESMEERWSGNSRQPTRWDVVVDAIIASVNSAPAGSQFAVVGTDNSSRGWYRISSFDHPNVHLTRSLIASPIQFTRTRSIANAYDGVIDDYLTLGGSGNPSREWRQMPFSEPCSSIEVIVISDGAGDGDDDHARDENFTGDVMVDRICQDEHECSGLHETGITLLDDVAFRAANTDLNGFHGGSQTVRTHTILLDALTQPSTLAEALFISTAEVSGGLYTRAEQPTDVAVGISLAMTDAMQSVLNVSTATTTVVGHRMFRTWTQISGELGGERGAPLYRGHIEAFQLNNQPSDPRYGEIVGGSLWDAAELLTQRASDAGGVNSYSYHGNDPETHERTLFTNAETAGTYTPRPLIPFDSTQADEIGELMLLDYDRRTPGTFGCPDYPLHDLNQDCSVDEDDAQLAIDFLRGVPDATFAGTSVLTGRERGAWRVGGMFLSVPAFSDAHTKVFTNDQPLVAFQQKMAQLDSVLYTSSNDGFLHAFKVPFLDADEDGWEDYSADALGGWELWAYIPRHVLDRESEYHDDVHGALNLMLDGESYLNDGPINLADVWMDGVANNLDGDCTSAAADGRVDADGCEYHRVLVASMGMGSRYHYALDVTHPHEPRFLWEWIGDRDGWRKGLGTGTPVVTSVYHAESRSDVPVVLWTSGTVDADDNIPERPRWPVPSQRQGNVFGVGARWYMFDLLDPSNSAFSQVGYQVDNSLSPFTRGTRDPKYPITDPAGGLFGTPAAVDYDEDGNVDALYMGSRHGYLYKVLLRDGDYSASQLESIEEGDGSTCVFHAPAEIRDSRVAGNDDLAVYYRPSVSRDSQGRVRVSWGTGWPGNVAEPYANGYFYSVIDGESVGDEWSCQEASVSSCGPAFDPLQLDPGEKLVGQVLTYGGLVMYTTYVADNADSGPACGVGHTRVYAMALDDCVGGYVEGRDWGPSAYTVTDSSYVEFEGIPSSWSFANQGIYLSVVLPDGSLQSIGPIRPEPTEAAGLRVAYTNWRHVL